MTTGRMRRSSSQLKSKRQKRVSRLKIGASRPLRLESLEDRRLLTLGPQLIGIQPNQGDLLADGDICNVAPEELRFRFNEGQIIDEATLGSILVTRAGGDGAFSTAAARTDFNTNGLVVMKFEAATPGPLGNEISLVFSKSDPGMARLPRVQVEGREITIELNANPMFRSTASDLIQAINNHPAARQLVKPTVVSGQTTTPIASPAITYSPVRLTGANVAQASTNFNAGNVEVAFTAVQTGPQANGISIEFTRADRGGAASPRIQVLDSRRIRIELNTNNGNQTTAGQLVSAFNADPAASAIATATLRVGSADRNIAASPTNNYSPLVLTGANDMAVVPGYVGLGSTPQEVIFRFAERLPDDLYRIDIGGTGSNPLRNSAGFALGDSTDNHIDDGVDFSLQFELDLGARILAVVPQPVVRAGNGALSQATDQIEVYFNDDDLDPVTAQDPAFYKLIYTNDTPTPADDFVFAPTNVQYSAQSDRVVLTFAQPLHLLVPGGTGSFRLRIGTDEPVASQANPMPPVQVDLRDRQDEVGATLGTAYSLGTLTGSHMFSSVIQPRVDLIPLPGSPDEPGQRQHLQPSANPATMAPLLPGVGDSSNGITTLYYNFRPDYGSDPQGNPLTNLITTAQKRRAREAFEVWGRSLGVQFVETATQGFTIATGDVRAIHPESTSAHGDGWAIAYETQPLSNNLRLVFDASLNWYDGFGPADSPLRESWFESAVQGIGRLLGLGGTEHLPPGTWLGSDPALAFNQPVEPIYPGDQDIVQGQRVYRPKGQDVDLYRFEVEQTGVFSAETIAQRQTNASLLDTYLKLYQQVDGGVELLAVNDDYYGSDSYLELVLQPGVYFVGVSSKGNEQYRPDVAGSAYGGITEGAYDLRLNFRPDAFSSIVDLDNAENPLAGELSERTPLDGNGDGVPGGVFNFWFRADPNPIVVDKVAPAGGNGTLAAPFNNLVSAMSLAQATASHTAPRVVRVVGNGGTDGRLQTPEDARPYEIGFDLLGRTLADGSRLEVPRNVTVMIDRGAVFKLRRGYIDVGSSSPTIDRSGGALQVLGTPRLLDAGGNVIRNALGQPIPGSVYFTSYNDQRLGGDSNPSVPQTPAPGDWGGLIFRNHLDRSTPGRTELEAGGSFLNTINHADIRYGGGSVVIDGQPRIIAPIYTVTARPTITNNTISFSADAAISMNPDSFEETNFHAPKYQPVGAPFTSDYTRVGPDIHGNRLVNNSINGLFVRMRTAPGGTLEQMTVPGRWNNTDIVHVVAEPLRIAGSPGGPIQREGAPDVAAVRLQTLPGNPAIGQIPAGRVDYRMSFVDAQGNETPASDPTGSLLIRVTNEGTGLTQRVRLTNLPVLPGAFTHLRIYRAVKSDYALVAQLDRAALQGSNYGYTDQGSEVGELWLGANSFLQGRPAGRLVIDPGTVVKLNGGTIETSFGSQLIAEGVAGREVVFTSLLDHRYGAGGTFRTSSLDQAEPGGWAGLYAGPMSQVSLDHAVVAYGGGIAEIPGAFAGFNALEIQQAKARVAHSVFEYNASGTSPVASTNRVGRGSNGEGVIFVRGAQPVVIDNVIRDNSGPAISINVNALNWMPVGDHGRSTGLADVQSQLVDNRGPLIRGNLLGNNDINGMQVRGGTLTTQSVWDDTDIVHVVLDDTVYVSDFHTYGGLRLQSSPRESLVVKLSGDNAGIVTTGRPLDITDRIGGMLHIVGQPGYPVILTSLRDDTAAAGFGPDGRPQGDTNNDGDAPGLGAPRRQLPTVPDIPDPDADPDEDELLIHNNVPESVPGRFGVVPGPGGSARFSDVVTAQGITQLFEDVSFLYDFLNYVDVGIDGQAFDLGTTMTDEPERTGPNEVTSSGTFAGPNGDIEWEVRTYFVPGFATLYNEMAFTSSEEFGDVRFINYLDQDILGPNDDLLYISTAPGTPNFEVFTLDNAERVGFSQGGVYAPGAGLVNATWDGWAADKFPLLKSTITGAGTTFSQSGNINTAHLTPFNDPDLGMVYGLADVTTAFAWTLNPGSDTATITTFVNLVLEDPIIDSTPQNFAGDWQSVRIEQFAHDRNVEIVLELESGAGAQAGDNETPATAQHLGVLAPHEKAADENQRLGFEIHGSLNRPGDVDVYSFNAAAGTQVWLDIDRTTRSLDTVLELINANGTVLARSVSSFDESANPGLLYAGTLPDGSPVVVNPLDKSPFVSHDHWSTNPADAGMRAVLPGPANSTNTYHVRVRSNSNDLTNLSAGRTMGVYQLQIRLRELDELPGSTIRMADIRYATNGIELIGQPYHSPLLGEAAEIIDPTQPTNDNNNGQDTAQNLGNLLATDRGTISVAGELFTAEDVDWYRFEIEYGPQPGGLTQGTWDVTGTLADTDWEGSTLVFQSQTPRGGDDVVTGYFDWVSAGVFRGREMFTGTVSADNTFQLTGTQILQGQQLTLGVYTGQLSADGRSITDGTRGPAPTGIPVAEGTWAADQVVPVPDTAPDPRHAALVFDIDYADGFARANTNLWVFDDQARLVLMGGDSNTPDDRPVGGTTGTEDLLRGSIGARDPFIGTVQMPAAGLAPGVYYVAVSSNAVIPPELQQFLSPTPDNPLLRLEPVNSVNRIAEDRIDGNGSPTTANATQIPVLFGAADRVTLFAPRGIEVADGETFSITDASGNTAVYEFALADRPVPRNVPVPYELDFTAVEVAEAIVQAIQSNPPASAILAVPGSELRDKQTFTITDQGGARTYEFDFNGVVTPGNVRVPVKLNFTAQQVATAIAESIRANPPQPVEADGPDDLPVFGPQTVNFSMWQVEAGERGEVTLREHVLRRTLLTTVTTFVPDLDDPGQRYLRSVPVVRDTGHEVAPAVRQTPASGETRTRVYISRPAAVPFELGDMTLFAVEPGVRDREGTPVTDNRNDLVAIDPFTGQLVSRVGSLGWNVGDLATLDAVGPDPASPLLGGLYAYSIAEPQIDDGQPPAILTTDVNTGNYVRIDPSSDTVIQIGTDLIINLGSSPGDSGIETSVGDPANPTVPTRVGDGVGVLFHAMTFNNPENADTVRGFAIGDRGDIADPLSGVARRQNLLFEFDPATGAVVPDAQQVNLNESGTNKVDLGTLLSWLDPFTAGGLVSTIAGLDATVVDATGRTLFSIGDTDFFDVDPGDGRDLLQFEFDAGFDFLIDVDANDPDFNPANPKVIFDQIPAAGRPADSFVVTTTTGDLGFEFSTGSVVFLFPGVSGANLVDTTRYLALQGYLLDIETVRIPGGVPDPNPGVKTFEFVPPGLAPLVPFATPIDIAPADAQAVIVDKIIAEVNAWGGSLVGGSVVAEELMGPTGRTGRITLKWVDQEGVGADTFFEVRAALRGFGGAPMPPTNIRVDGAVGVTANTIPVYVEETSSAAEIGQAIVRAVRTNPIANQLFDVGALGDRVNFQRALDVDFSNVLYQSPLDPPDPDDVIFTQVGSPGVSINKEAIPFLAHDDAVRIAGRIYGKLQAMNPPVPAVLDGNLVILENDGASFFCDFSVTGTPHCPLPVGTPAPGGSITGMAFVGPQLYTVTETGGLFRIVDRGTGQRFEPDVTADPESVNVLDYVDGSQQLLTRANPLPAPEQYHADGAQFSRADRTITLLERDDQPEKLYRLDPKTGELVPRFVVGGTLSVTGSAFNDTQSLDDAYTIAEISAPRRITVGGVPLTESIIKLSREDRLTDELVPGTMTITLEQTHQPIRFTGLVAGPKNVQYGRYENLLFGMSDFGRLFAFDTFGQPQPVFANSMTYIETGITESRGIAFAPLDSNLWHATTNRGDDPGHGINAAFDGSRIEVEGNSSLYFGYEGPLQQPQFGTGSFATATQAFSYDFLGGTHGSLVSNPFSLQGYASADKPVLYFNYFLETEDAAADLMGTDRMTDALRVYLSGDDGQWKLLSTNNSARGPRNDADEFDRFLAVNPETGNLQNEQPFSRAETFDVAEWRQARIDLSPYAGQDDLRLRFDFSTAGGMSSGGRDLQLDLNTAGNHLRAIPGWELRDGQYFTLTDLVEDPNTGLLRREIVVAFELDLGPTIVTPTGAAVSDGARFSIDGRVYEFDNDGAVGQTNGIPHVPVPFVGTETAGELAAVIQQVLTDTPPPPQEFVLDLDPSLEPNDTLATAVWTPLDGSNQILRGTGVIGDNASLADPALDVDLLAFPLYPGDTLIVETDTTGLDSELDTYLRLFDANGLELAANDNQDPGDPLNRDSRIVFTAPQRGTYYVGISGAHNRNYLPTVSGSGLPEGPVTEGSYAYTVSVSRAVGPQRAGNRVNLPAANVAAAVSGLPGSFVEGAGGVASSAMDSQGRQVPVVRVPIHAAMSSLHVADVIRAALADGLGSGNADAVVARHESVQIVHYGVGEPGPFGLSGPSDLATALPGSGLFGDRFGAFGASTDVGGVFDPVDYPGALGMRNNQFEGVYIDDIIIGFAARGEMVTGALEPEEGEPVVFVPNTGQPANEINRGRYQLEIRQATPYGVTHSGDETTLMLDTGFDINDRLAEGTSITVDEGSVFADGQTFTIRGTEAVVFEFEDLTLANGVTPGHVPIPFDPGDSAVAMARRIRDVLNQPAVQQRLQLRAATSDGVVSGTVSTSNRLHLFGDVSVIAGLVGNGPTGNVPVQESNDTLADAVETGILPGGRMGFFATGFIGDNPDPALPGLAADVDLFKVELREGEAVTIDIAASVIGSPLDSLLRVFDANGSPVMKGDEYGVLRPVESDDDLGPGERPYVHGYLPNRDSYLNFIAPADGVYYIGVGAFGNGVYDPRDGSGRRVGRTTGKYEIRIDRPLVSPGLVVETYRRQGDQNLRREQGQMFIHSNRISSSLENGILIDAGIRGRDGMPQPGPVRNLITVNTWNLAPGVTIANNIIEASGTAGIRYTGHAGANGVPEAVGPVPFGRIINNTIVGAMASSDVPIDVQLKALPGLIGGFNPATTVYMADLSSLTDAPISSLRITDNSVDLLDEFGGPLSGRGAVTGLDLDAVKLSASLAFHASQVPGLPALDVFDFSPAGTILDAGTQVDPVAFELFGTSGGFVNNTVATLGVFDADAASGTTAGGFVSLGEGGSITFRFDPPLIVTSPLYLYIGEANDVGEMNAASVQVTSAEVPRGQGIVIENNVSPTLLNNVFSTLETGIQVDPSSSSTVIGGSLYHNNTTHASGTGLGSHPIVVEPTTRLFADPDRGNYYPLPGSPVIDSAVDSLEDRPQMRQVQGPLGIGESPILAPTYDVSGQLRINDPTAAPPPGLGENVFKDRGAQERADFQGPFSFLTVPLDNGPADLDRSPTRVNLARATLQAFEIQLSDRDGPMTGIGIDDSTVTKNTVRVYQNAHLLTEGRDYLFSYNPTSSTIRLTPLAGVWQQNSSYRIELVGSSQQVIFGRSGDKLSDGDQFQLTDASGLVNTFEYDSGYVMQIPQTLALQVPAAGGGAGGVADGDTITVSSPVRTTTLELDSNGVVTPGNRRVPFTAFSTRGEIADAIVNELRLAGVQLTPVNVGNGLVHLGVNGTQTMSVVSDTIVPLGVADGVFNGQTFSIDDGTRVVTFEFNTAGGVGPGRVPINYTLSQTYEQVAQAVASAINSQNLGLNAKNLGDGTVQIGGNLNHVVRIGTANVGLTGRPSVQQAFGMRIPTVGGSISAQILDGQTFTISDGRGVTVTFEFDNNNRTTAGNVAIPFTATTTPSQLANTMVNRIRTTSLGLFPSNAGNGIVILAADSRYTLDVANSNLMQVGVPGMDAAIPIPFTPSATFTSQMAATETARAINAQTSTGLAAKVEQDRVLVTGATAGSGSSVGFVEGIRDLAGNPLAGNQTDGSTSFTVFVGKGMSYGDAPHPYPTLRADNGARHVIVDGFSLGPSVSVSADGLPTAGADAIPGHDGVSFDPNQPLIPNRPYTIRITTPGNDCSDAAVCVVVSGVGTAVSEPAYLDVWMDWNRNGSWGDSGDQVVISQALTLENLANGGITLNRTVPPGAVAGETYARFRLSTATALTPVGETDAGEVEDYQITIARNPWQNPVNRFDVNNDGYVSPLDVLLVINYINDPSNDLTQRLPAVKPPEQPFLDVNGSGFIEQNGIDALGVINHLNTMARSSGGEGEAPTAAVNVRRDSGTGNHLDDILARDEGWMDILGDIGQAQQAMDARDAVFAAM